MGRFALGKLITGILLVAAALAVAFVPGVGAAIGMAVFQGGLGIGLGVGAAAALANAAIAGIVLGGLTALGGLLGIGPSPERPETAQTTIKTPRPPRVSAYGRGRLYGAYILFEAKALPASTGKGATPGGDVAIDVYAVHDGKINGVVTHYLDDQPCTVVGGVVQQGADGRYAGGVVQFYTTDGSAPGAGIPVLADALPGIWSNDHRGDGVVLIALSATSVKSDKFQKVYPQSRVPTPSIVAEWQLCPNPSALDPLDESGWTWTRNPVRQLLHYKIVREGPKPSMPKDDPAYPAALLALRTAWWNRHIAPTLSYWIDAAADCDAPRALKAGGTEPRYRSDVQHKHTDQHVGPVSALLATFDGWLCPRPDGALLLYSGKYYEPTVSIGPDEILSYNWDGGDVDDGEAVNEIICTYVSAAHDYNSVECDAWRDEADITRRGQILSTTLDLQVPSHAQVRYLAKRLMQRRNAPARGTVTTNLAGRAAQGERFVNLRLEEAGAVFFDGPVEIIGLTRNARGGVTFRWVAADPNIDDWNPALEEGEPAANGSSVSPTDLDPPSLTGLTQDGQRVVVSATGPERDDLTWSVRWRATGDTAWSPDEIFTDAGGGAVTLPTSTVPPGVDVEVEVAYQVGDGRASDYSTPDVIPIDELIYDGQIPLP